MANPNIELLTSIANAMGALREQVVFVGGCATGLLITQSLVADARATEDVDAIVEVASLVGYHGHHAIGQPHGQRFVGSHRAAGQNQVERARQPDQPGQAHRAAVDQRHAPAPAIHAEDGRLFRDPQVTPKRELQAASNREPGDGRNHRFVEQQARGTHRASCAFLGLITMTMLGFPFWLAVISAIGGMAAFGILLERAVIRPILGQPAFSIVMLTIGVGYVARGLVTMIPNIGTDTHTLPVPYKDMIWKFGGNEMGIGALVISAEQLVVIVSTAALCGLLFTVFRFSKVGIAMQASSQNQLAAYYMGIPVKRLNGLVWGLAAAVAAVAGLLLAPITFVHANMGFIGLKAFPAAVVGGFGSLPGAIVGGLIIGLVESFSGFYLPEGFKDIAAYIVVLVMLMVKPNGLFGEKLRKKV
jgi:branched-chain amino acid transport system permease protein